MPRGAKPDDSLRRLVLVFAAAAAALWILSLMPLLHGRSTPLFPSGPNFEDIIVYKGRFTLFHTAKFFTSRRFSGFAYPAGSAIIYAAFYSVPDPIRAYLFLSAVVAAIAILFTVVHLRRAGIPSLLLPLLLLSFPFIFLVQRANIEIILFVFIATGIVAYRRGFAHVAAVLFGLAAACKLYPLFLLGLFLKRRPNFPAFVTGVLSAILAMCAAIAYAGPGFLIAARGFFNGVGHFQDHYAQTVRSAEINWDHCLFSPIKYWSSQTHAPLAPLMQPYYLIAGTLAILLFLRVRTLPFLNQVIFLTAAMLALPPVSYAYTLVHLYLPALLLLTAIARNHVPATAPLALAIVFFLMLPLTGFSGISVLPTGPIQAFFVLALLIIPALQPWQTTLAHEVTE